MSVVVIEADELAALIRREVRAALDERQAPDEAAPWLDTSAAAALLGVEPRTLQRRAAAGEIPAARVGRVWRFRRADLERLLTGP